MSKKVLQINKISKQYRLGQLGTGTISHDLNRFWHRLRGKEDPYLRVSEVNDRSKSTEGNYVWALKDVSFELEPGDVLGIIGTNGAGKSTLLKLISRITSPTSGDIRFNGRMSSLLEVGTGFHYELTGRENIYLNGAILGMTKKEITERMDQIIEFSGCGKYIDTPVKRYSSGMVVRLGFSVAAHLESEILVVDEVLAVGDLEFQNKCIGKMQDISKGGRTVLFVSHNLSSVKKLCNKGLLIEEGTSTYFGDIDETIHRYLHSEASSAKSQIDLSNIKRVGNGIIQFQSLNLEVDGKLTTKLMIGDSLTLKIKLKSSESIRYKMAIHIYRGDQTRLANIENMDSGLELEPFIGEKEMTVTFKNMRFYPNNYLLSLWLGDVSSHEHIDYVRHCARFEIVEGAEEVPRELPSPTGVIYLTPDWTIKDN